ncbi:helix-turn-helix domain-containing protein [Cohnella nanjingensis]|uniref:Helix-turn-helix transcriptional regulator n=1 Tax=Cohnella nanjingensis TaxID=1387779 RepID=A0A7X0VJG6_9BACL|nr:AraC family transcriptional regulator [Cohnella nanjingensis]MBB6674694.1 helix-turn-helix transcriptional regulator [Cohnella nanjingensis]
MRLLSEITPHLGDSMPYLYDGSANEKWRVCNVYALHLFPEGPGEMEIEGKRYPIDRRTVVFLRPEQPHAFHIDASHPLASYNLYFDLWDRVDPISVNRTFIYAPEPYLFRTSSPVFPCGELDALPGIFSLQPHPQLYDALVAVAKTYVDSLYYRDEAVNSLLYAWFLGWHNAIRNRQPSDYRIVRLLTYLDFHLDRREPVETWSKMCGLKRTYFHELFLRETGMTPKAYHHKLRMRRAAHLLQESDLSVTAIAEKLGYLSIHPFTRHFSAYYGASPKRYRLGPPTGP